MCVLDESGTDEAECSRKAASGRRLSGASRSLVNTRGLQLECARVLYETLVVPVLMYGSETMTGKEEERSSIKACSDFLHYSRASASRLLGSFTAIS